MYIPRQRKRMGTISRVAILKRSFSVADNAGDVGVERCTQRLPRLVLKVLIANLLVLRCRDYLREHKAVRGRGR